MCHAPGSCTHSRTLQEQQPCTRRNNYKQQVASDAECGGPWLCGEAKHGVHMCRHQLWSVSCLLPSWYCRHPDVAKPTEWQSDVDLVNLTRTFAVSPAYLHWLSGSAHMKSLYVDDMLPILSGTTCSAQAQQPMQSQRATISRVMCSTTKVGLHMQTAST